MTPGTFCSKIGAKACKIFQRNGLQSTSCAGGFCNGATSEDDCATAGNNYLQGGGQGVRGSRRVREDKKCKELS